MHQWLRSSFEVTVTLTCALIGAFIFETLHAPLPWLLGAIVAIAIASRIKKLPLRSPKLFSAPARAILGITIGSAFNPTILHSLEDFISSIVLILPYVLCVSFAGMLYYWKWLKFDKATAFFSAMPGGLLEMVILAESMKANVYKVTLTQSARLLLIVFTLPFVIQYLSHIPLDGRASIIQPLMHSDPQDMMIITIGALVGWLGANKLKIQGGTMIGPVIVGAIIYGSGWVHSRPPSEVIKVIQLILGSMVGFVFVGIRLKEIAKVLSQSLGHFVILSIISVCFVLMVSTMVDIPLISILLSFSPGGQSEMNIMAILVGANLPYVALHHIVRLFLVMSVAPILMRKLSKKSE